MKNMLVTKKREKYNRLTLKRITVCVKNVNGCCVLTLPQ